MFYDPFVFPAFGKCWSSSKEYSKFKPMLAIEKTTTCNKEKYLLKICKDFKEKTVPEMKVENF